MKKFYFLILALFGTLISNAQEVEQSIDALSFHNEGGTVIIEFIVPKTDSPVTPQYYVKDVFVDPFGDTFRATSVSGEMTYIQPGKHVVYWNLQNDAPSLSSIRGVYLVLRLTDETLQQVEEFKRKQKDEESKRILDQIREQERKRVEDSIARLNVKKEEPIIHNDDDDVKSQKHTQFGITFGVGTGGADFDNGDDPRAMSGLMFDKDAISWNAGLLLRTHLWSWLGLQGGVVYHDYKQAYKIDATAYYNEAQIVKVPITVHLYLGSKFNFFGGYYFNYYQKAFTYESGGGNKLDLLDEAGSKMVSEKGNGFCYGLEIKGKHSALTFTYETDKTNFLNLTNLTVPQRKNTLLSANFSIFF
jgi:hypothetical protein